MKAKISVTVFLLSIVITGIFWAVLPESYRNNESIDYFLYYEPEARQILHGQGFTMAGGEPAIRYPPGYPLVLASIFALARSLSLGEGVVLAAFILFCTGLSTVLLFLLASQVFDWRLGLAGALLWMTYPFNLWLTKQPNSEIPFMVLFFASALLLWGILNAASPHRARALTLGVLTGFAALIRPAAIGLPVIFSGLILFWPANWSTRSRLFGIGAMAAGCLIAVMPWETWVYKHTQQTIPLSTGGTLGVWDGLTYAVLGGVGSRHWVTEDMRDFMENIVARGGEIFNDASSGVGEVFIQEAAQNPRGALELIGLKTIRSWYGTESGRLELPNALLQGVYLIAIAWGGLTAWQGGAIERRYLVFIAVLALYFWLMTIAVLSILRYMVPVMGLLITLVPAGVWRFSSVRAAVDRWIPLE